MYQETLPLHCEGSQAYAALSLYIHDKSPEIQISERPCILICPGGGYEMTSDREAECIALQFLAFGYHAAVLRYSVDPAVYPTALLEVGKSISYLRENAEPFGIKKDAIYVAGFSAGGHLAASYGCFWNHDFVSQSLSCPSTVLQPNGMILGYPVITSGEYGHQDSFRHLLGAEYESKKASLSLEHCVTEAFPKTFVWHTFEDGLVPCQNSLLLVEELVKHHIPVDYHLFTKGGHGLSLANKLTQMGDYGVEPSVEPWITLVHNWLKEYEW